MASAEPKAHAVFRALDPHPVVSISVHGDPFEPRKPGYNTTTAATANRHNARRGSGKVAHHAAPIRDFTGVCGPQTTTAGECPPRCNRAIAVESTNRLDR